MCLLFRTFRPDLLILQVLGLGFLVYGAGLVAYQVIAWLYHGIWIELPLMYLFATPPSETVALNQPNPLPSIPALLRGTWSWLLAPENWLGLHSVVSWLFSSLSVPFTAVLLGIIWLMEARARYEDT